MSEHNLVFPQASGVYFKITSNHDGAPKVFAHCPTNQLYDGIKASAWNSVRRRIRCNITEFNCQFVFIGSPLHRADAHNRFALIPPQIAIMINRQRPNWYPHVGRTNNRKIILSAADARFCCWEQILSF